MDECTVTAMSREARRKGEGFAVKCLHRVGSSAVLFKALILKNEIG